MSKTTYVAVHHHRHGISVFPFQSALESFDEMDIAKALAIDYEPEKEEFIEISQCDFSNIPEVEEAADLLTKDEFRATSATLKERRV